MPTPNRVRAIGRMFSQQLFTIVILIIVVWVGIGRLAAIATVMGALLAWSGQMAFALSTFQLSGYQARHQIVRRLYRGQLFKWLITLTGFAVIFYALDPQYPLYVIGGYVVMQVSHTIGLFRLR